LPRSVTATVVGQQTIDVDPTAQANNIGQELKPKTIYSVGKHAYDARMKSTNSDNLQMHFPIERGIIDFEHEQDYLTELLKNIFEKDLGLEPRNMKVLMTDCPFNKKEDKIRLTTMMFDTFKVQSFALINTAVLSLFSTGKTCGLVAECGEGVTYTVPIFEGYALPHAMHSLKVAG